MSFYLSDLANLYFKYSNEETDQKFYLRENKTEQNVQYTVFKFLFQFAFSNKRQLMVSFQNNISVIKTKCKYAYRQTFV